MSFSKDRCGNLVPEDNFDETAEYKESAFPHVLYKFVSLYDEDQDEHNKEDNEKSFLLLKKAKYGFLQEKQ